MPRIRRGLLLALFAASASIWLFSCRTGRVATQAGPALAVSPPAVKKKMETFDARIVVREARADILKGRYEKAIMTYRDALTRHPGDPVLVAGYESGLFEARRAADLALGRKEFARAGVLYRLIAQNHAGAPDKGVDMSLMRRVGICANALTEKGLALYRQGRLREAIVCWRRILEFDPADSKVRKAVETARLQIRNLSK